MRLASTAERGEEWGTLLMNALSIVYQFLVPAILVQEGADFLRPQYHNERHLSPVRRREVDLLVDAIRASFEGIAGGTLDQARVRKVYEQLAGAIWSELQQACELHGVAYPARRNGDAGVLSAGAGLGVRLGGRYRRLP